MLKSDTARPDTIVESSSEGLHQTDLPPPETTRWVVRRKAQVVAAVSDGVLGVREACDRYGLTLEELASWQRAVDREGMPGLRATRVQHYRHAHEREGRRA